MFYIAGYIKELFSIIRFFTMPSRNRRVVFYSEKDSYFAYYEGIINKLVRCSPYPISYITSDINDSIFTNNNIVSFYINKLFSIFIRFLRCNCFVMTLTDLGRFNRKTSIFNVHYVYAFHSIDSIHMTYLDGAFDKYNSILCTGKYHIKEIRKTEKMKCLKPKILVKTGHYRIERIYDSCNNYERNTNKNKNIVIAPSWHKGNILEVCANHLIDTLLSKKCFLTIRIHPETIKRHNEMIEQLKSQYLKTNTVKTVRFEESVCSDDSLIKADILITDWSSVAFDYCFGVERPVIFINTPAKIRNLFFDHLNITPFEVNMRKKVGIAINQDKIKDIHYYIDSLLNNYDVNELHKLREKYIYNFGTASSIACAYILSASGIYPELLYLLKSSGFIAED